MKCEICSGNTRVLISEKNPKSSEYYCEKCDKSFLMSEGEYREESVRKKQFQQQVGMRR
jgi:transposase-like protein